MGRRPRPAWLAGLLAGVVAATLGAGAGPARPAVAQPVPSEAPIATSPATPAPPRPTTAAPPAPVPARLSDELAAALARFPDLAEAGTVGIAVQAADGTPVWSSPDAGLGLLPASTMKSLAAGSVLSTLGPTGTLTTTAISNEPVGRDGTIEGALVLRGVGDPTLTSDDYRRWVYPSRPSIAIEDLADAVVSAGVRRIAGDVVGDGTGFGPGTSAAGWPSRYFGDFDAHHLSALTIDTGRLVEVDDRPGRAVSVRIEQEPDPVLRTALLFARALAERGVVIDGRVRRATAPTRSQNPVAAIESSPMSEVLTFMLQESDNHLADSLVRAVALEDVGDGSWEAAGDRVKTGLHDLGVDTTGFVLSDGSGLSRTNRVSAELLAANDRVQFDQWGRTWSNMLPIAGEAGTLEGRLIGTPAQGRVHAKTGTLDDVRGLAGHVLGTGDDRYHFALLVNDVDPDIRYRVSELGDELSLVLTDALDRCRRTRVVRVPVEPSPNAPAPSATGTPASDPPTPATERQVVTATGEDPGPPLSSADWRRRCPG